MRRSNEVASVMLLTIGSKTYSSWSFRVWLLMRQAGIDLRTRSIPFRTIGSERAMSEETKMALAAASPSSMVPVLEVDSIRIWDSLAICEFLAERYPCRALWPKDDIKRSIARSVSAEMHSGFSSLRSSLPFFARAVASTTANEFLSAEVCRDIARIEAIWSNCSRQYCDEGPFLFGRFCIADAMFAPVALRFHTYRISLSSTAQAYVEKILALAATQEWITGAKRETEKIVPIDKLVADFQGNVASIKNSEEIGRTVQ